MPERDIEIHTVTCIDIMGYVYKTYIYIVRFVEL